MGSRMILIVESGATKGDWRVISPSGEESARFLSGGTNVSTMTADAVRRIITETSEKIAASGYDIEKIWFYTAGIPTQEAKELRRTSAIMVTSERAIIFTAFFMIDVLSFVYIF